MWCSAVGCIVTFTLSMLVVPLLAVAQPVGRSVRATATSASRRMGLSSLLTPWLLHGTPPPGRLVYFSGVPAA